MIDNESADAPRIELNWAASKTIGGISEIAVLSPIRRGCVPGERRTYEERLAFAIDNLADRHRQGLPTELGRIPSIHFGRMIIIRPEQYLLYSEIKGVDYYPPDERSNTVDGRIPRPIDDYVEQLGRGNGNAERQRVGPDQAAIAVGPPSAQTGEEAKPAQQADRAIGEHEPKKADTPKLRSFLLTLVEFDGDLKIYMRDVAEFLAGDFDRVFENCEDYPTTQNFEPFWRWIKRYQINTNLLYAPYSNLSVARIKQLEDFKRRFDALVARIYSPTGARIRSVEELFDEFLQQSQQYARNFPTPGGIFETDKS